MIRYNFSEFIKYATYREKMGATDVINLSREVVEDGEILVASIGPMMVQALSETMDSMVLIGHDVYEPHGVVNAQSFNERGKGRWPMVRTGPLRTMLK